MVSSVLSLLGWLAAIATLVVILRATRRDAVPEINAKVESEMLPGGRYYGVTTDSRARLVQSDPRQHLSAVFGNHSQDMLIFYPTQEDALKAWMGTWRDRAFSSRLVMMGIELPAAIASRQKKWIVPCVGRWPGFPCEGWQRSVIMHHQVFEDVYDSGVFSAQPLAEADFTRVQDEWRKGMVVVKEERRQQSEWIMKQIVESHRQAQANCTKCGFPPIDAMGCECVLSESAK